MLQHNYFSNYNRATINADNFNVTAGREVWLTISVRQQSMQITSMLMQKALGMGITGIRKISRRLILL